jgi:hypothetical protein
MNEIAGVRIDHRLDEMKSCAAETAGLVGLILDGSNLLSSKYFHGGPHPQREFLAPAYGTLVPCKGRNSTGTKLGVLAEIVHSQIQNRPRNRQVRSLFVHEIIIKALRKNTTAMSLVRCNDPNAHFPPAQIERCLFHATGKSS